eukprot:4887320-Amphidinium_carterae.1
MCLLLFVRTPPRFNGHAAMLLSSFATQRHTFASSSLSERAVCSNANAHLNASLTLSWRQQQ